MEISAKVIADSIANNTRITTLELCYHRFIHSEFMTHRMFSRNASSSRAIPVERVLNEVKTHPAMPIHWGKNQPGMQAREEVSNVKLVKDIWGFSGIDAISNAEELAMCGVHKQVVNRILEPFQFIKVIVTATEYDNFFTLRCHADAQPEICLLAKTMKAAMVDSIPNKLEHGEWHLPYVTQEQYTSMMVKGFSHIEAIKCSVARCARVSYLNHDKSTPDINKDILLADDLLADGHMSPFEHIATPMEYWGENLFTGWVETKPKEWDEGITHLDRNGNYWSGNFRGFLQYRQML